MYGKFYILYVLRYILIELIIYTFVSIIIVYLKRETLQCKCFSVHKDKNREKDVGIYTSIPILLQDTYLRRTVTILRNKC